MPRVPEHRKPRLAPCGTHAILPLTMGQEALIDVADMEHVGQWLWHAVNVQPTSRGGDPLWYARRSDRTYLHQALMDARLVDHRSGNGLDCRRANMRLATSAQNSANQRLSRRSTTGLKGVTRTQDGRYRASLGVGSGLFLGSYWRRDEAGYAYDRAALRVYGPFAATNVSLGLLPPAPPPRQLELPLGDLDGPA